MQESLFDFSTPAAPIPAPSVVTLIEATQPRIAPAETLASAARRFAEFFAREVRLEWADVNVVMGEAFGGSDAEGAWTPQDAYNALEMGLVSQILSNGSLEPEQIERMERYNALLPTHRRRTETTIALQQFSTPAPLALVAARAAAIQKNELVLEPSVGTGMLAAFAHLAGARLALNDVDEDRLAACVPLRPQHSTSHDARYLSALYRGEAPTRRPDESAVLARRQPHLARPLDRDHAHRAGAARSAPGWPARRDRRAQPASRKRAGRLDGHLQTRNAARRPGHLRRDVRAHGNGVSHGDRRARQSGDRRSRAADPLCRRTHGARSLRP